MNPTRIILAIELTSYREAFALALQSLRPDVRIFQAEENELDREVRRLLPDMVVCSRLTKLVEDRIPIWVELYPDCGPRSVVCIRGTRLEIEDMQLSDLLSVVDQTSYLAHSS